MAERDGNPPRDPKLEISILGSMLVDRKAAETAIRMLGEQPVEDGPFYSECHNLIYASAVWLQNKGRNIDVIEMTNVLRRSNRLDEVGWEEGLPGVYGPGYLAELAFRTITTANVDSYCRILLELKMQRDALIFAKEVQAKILLQTDDIFELLSAWNDKIYSLASQKHKGGPVDASKIVIETLDQIEKTTSDGSGLVGVPSGIREFDDLTGGFMPGEVTIIAGRPSMGKTALACTIAVSAALNYPIEEKRVPVLIFSLEMKKEKLMVRMLSNVAKVNSIGIRRNQMSLDEWDRVGLASKELGNAPIWIDESSGLTPTDIRTTTMEFIRKHGIGLVIIDYLQLVRSGRRYGPGERTQEVGYISGRLHDIAKDLNVPIILLCQMNRSIETGTYREPQLSDLKQSGDIEQDADIVLFIHEPREKKDAEQSEFGFEEFAKRELIIRKARDSGTGSVRTRYYKQWNSFADINAYQP